MKLETKKTVLQNTIPERNSRKEIIGEVASRTYRFRYFHDLYLKKKKKGTGLDFFHYSKVIITFLGFYFVDFYFRKSDMYFFLGGMLKKTFMPPKIKRQRRGKSENRYSKSEGSIALFWYLRPNDTLYYKVKLKKLTGSTNRLPKLERLFMLNSDTDNLSIFTTELGKARKNKTLFVCGQTSNLLKK